MNPSEHGEIQRPGDTQEGWYKSPAMGVMSIFYAIHSDFWLYFEQICEKEAFSLHDCHGRKSEKTRVFNIFHNIF